jgi:hypothetical protein
MCTLATDIFLCFVIVIIITVFPSSIKYLLKYTNCTVCNTDYDINSSLLPNLPSLDLQVWRAQIYSFSFVYIVLPIVLCYETAVCYISGNDFEFTVKRLR